MGSTSEKATSRDLIIVRPIELKASATVALHEKIARYAQTKAGFAAPDANADNFVSC